MRATIQQLRTPWRRVTALVAAGMLAVGVLATPASAATPNWSMDPVVLLPSAVTPGEAAGYQVTIRNAGPSSIAQLFLVGYLGGTQDPSPNPVFTQTTRGSCPNTGGTLYCTLGALKKGQSVQVTVAFSTPANATSFSIDFEANTTGATSSDGGTSHGDTIEATGTTTLSADADFGGRFVTPGFQTVANNQSLGANNLQTTKVESPGVNFGVTVADGTPASWCPTCTAESSEVHVNNGALFSQGFRIDIQVDNSLVGGSLNIVYHERDDLTVEQITNQCPKNGNPNQNQMPCFRTQNLGGGDVLVIVWTKVNGKFSF